MDTAAAAAANTTNSLTEIHSQVSETSHLLTDIGRSHNSFGSGNNDHETLHINKRYSHAWREGRNGWVPPAVPALAKQIHSTWTANPPTIIDRHLRSSSHVTSTTATLTTFGFHLTQTTFLELPQVRLQAMDNLWPPLQRVFMSLTGFIRAGRSSHCRTNSMTGLK